MKARVFVTLKPSVLDPQGKVIREAMDHMGFHDVEDVRAGKMFEISFSDKTPKAELESRLTKICDKLLANTVIENFRWEIVDGKRS